MRLTALASAMFALVGTTPTFWTSDTALTAPEPMWLALWGLALIGFSKTLRARNGLVGARQPQGPAAWPLDKMRRSVPEPISSRA